MPPRSVSPVSESYPGSSGGSRRIVAGLLRGLGQVLEGWADRLESAIIQATTTLPDPRVRKDLFATGWRVWLTIVTQLERRLPQGWGAIGVGLVPIAIVGTLVSVGIWFLLHLGSTPEPTASEDLRTSPAMPPTTIAQPIAPPASQSSEIAPPLNTSEVSNLQDFQRSSEAEAFRRDNFSREDFRGENFRGENLIREDSSPEQPLSSEPDMVPLGPPVPDWTTIRVASPLELMLQTKLIQGLPRSLQPLIQYIQVNFRQQELTIHLTAQWQTLTSADQDQFVERVRIQAQKLDFPHLQIMDEQGNLLARTAIVGQGIIFLSPF